jgi:hypothetical protein
MILKSGRWEDNAAMTVEIKMGLDGILRVKLSGDLDTSMVESLRRKFSPYIDAATSESPLNCILSFHQLGKLSFATRRYLTELNQDPRYGAAAYLKPPRKAKVLAQFIKKGSNRDNINYFETEQAAIEWLDGFKHLPVLE